MHYDLKSDSVGKLLYNTMEAIINMNCDTNYTFVKIWRKNNAGESTVDISVFETDEWAKVLKMSKVFDQAVNGLSNASDYAYANTSDGYKRAAYFLYYADFTPFYYGFSDLESGLCDKKDLYEMVLEHVSNGNNVSINAFRQWLADNFFTIEKYHKTLTRQNESTTKSS
jgi:hypothetical protein